MYRSTIVCLLTKVGLNSIIPTPVRKYWPPLSSSYRKTGISLPTEQNKQKSNLSGELKIHMIIVQIYTSHENNANNNRSESV